MVNKKICVMGSYVTDLTAYAQHLPIKGETILGTKFRTGSGGKGSNQAIAAKRAGGDVTLITKIGRDIFGSFALDNFKKEGLYSPYIFIDEDGETGAALIMVDYESNNLILVVPGACNNISQIELESCASILKESHILLTQLEVNIEATKKIIEMAQKKGIITVLNPAPIQDIDDELFSKIDIITPNEVEASILSGMSISNSIDCKKAAEYFFKKGVKKVAITLGELGVYCNDGVKDMMIPAVKVHSIDTTGAGDAFNGGFVVGLSEGKDFFQACIFGSFVATLSVTKYGTAIAMPKREEIDVFYNDHYDFIKEHCC